MGMKDLRRKRTRWPVKWAKFDAKGKLLEPGVCSDRPPRPWRRPGMKLFGRA